MNPKLRELENLLVRNGFTFEYTKTTMRIRTNDLEVEALISNLLYECVRLKNTKGLFKDLKRFFRNEFKRYQKVNKD